MTGSLKILMVSAECIPFAKTGGLGDVVGTLPQFLKKMGNDVRVVIPKYSFIDFQKYNISCFIKSMGVLMGNTMEYCSVYKTITLEDIPVYFIEFDSYFNRSGIYHDDDFNDYHDNPKRFAFLSKAALQLCHELDFKPNIVHANDWHTALLPAYLKTLYKNDPIFNNTASVLTIHNIAYQGIYPSSYYDYIGLPEADFTPDKFEYYNNINILKGGIHYADMVNTVSHGYAAETKTQEGGYGLDYFLNLKGDNYLGILNGVDNSQWNPATDTLIPSNFDNNKLDGKYLCKKVLQEKLGLNPLANTPVIGIVSRFVKQKGLHLLSECIEDIVFNMEVQFAILGNGDKQLEAFFGSLPQKYPGKIGVFIGYSNELAHLIEAGSDFFLMPSIFEPCGLNQIYSLKYGTLPIVSATGGLDDTVENYNEKTGEGTGFKFWQVNSQSIYFTVGWAVSTYYDRKPHMNNLIQNAMSKVFSWENSTLQYVALYNRAIDNKKAIP